MLYYPNYFKETNPHIVEQEKSYYKWYRAEVKETPNEGKDVVELKSENQRLKTELYNIYSSKTWKVVGGRHFVRPAASVRITGEMGMDATPLYFGLLSAIVPAYILIWVLFGV